MPQLGQVAKLDSRNRNADRVGYQDGVTFFDTADVYPLGGTLERAGRTEEFVGTWLKGRRAQIVLATKFFGRMGDGPNDAGGSRKHIMQAVEASLRRLQTDYVDLYQMHAPDYETPLDETLRALDDLVRSGKVRYTAHGHKLRFCGVRPWLW
jgi:aryl-alcohol dehydrogenase-like predicted oxidoreductase